MLNWDNVAPAKRIILSKRICPLPVVTTTGIRCPSSHISQLSTPIRRHTIVSLNSEGEGNENSYMRLSVTYPSSPKIPSKSASFDSAISSSLISRHGDHFKVDGRKFSETQFSNSDYSSAIKSQDMKTPGDLDNFSLETRVSSGSWESFSSLNQINKNVFDQPLQETTSTINHPISIKNPTISHERAILRKSPRLTTQTTHSTGAKYRISSSREKETKLRSLPSKFVNSGD